MNTDFLYDTLLQEFGRREIVVIEVPNIITGNLKAGFGKRDYQAEAFHKNISSISAE